MSRKALLKSALTILLAFCCSGCGDLWEPGRRRVKRRAHDLQIYLTQEDYKSALEMCTKDAVWQRADGKSAPIRYLFADLKEISRKRAFYIVPKNHKEISDKKIVLLCDMRQQIQVGLIDVGNHMWESQIVWIEEEPRKWKVSKIKDLGNREYERSK